MNRKLILLTNHFPFFPGEQFLETEVKHLGTFFDVVDVIPIEVATIGNFCGSSDHRDLPVNVLLRRDILEDLSNENKKLQQFKHSINWSKNPAFLKMLSIEVTQMSGARLKSLVRAFKFWYKGNLIRHVLEKHYIDDSSQLIFYSYWMMQSALGITLANIGDSVRVTRVHGYDLYHFRYKPPYIPFRDIILEKMDKVFLISEQGLEYLSNRYPRYAYKMHLSRLGVQDGRMACYASTDDLFRIVSCSYLTPIKRVENIVRAIALLDFKVEWTHIGKGEQEIIIKDLCEKLPNNIRVNLLGELKNSEVYQYYKDHQVDCFINVSQIEGLPVSIMEALSYGIPIIATEVGGTSELVGDENGFLLSPNPSINDIAQALKYFRYLPTNLKDKMRGASYRKYKAKVDASKQYTEFAETLVDIQQKRSNENPSCI